MKALSILLAASTMLLGCAAPHPSPPVARGAFDHVAEGKLFYQLGRWDDSKAKLELALSETSDLQLRARANHFLELIRLGIRPEPLDPRVPRCFGP